MAAAGPSADSGAPCMAQLMGAQKTEARPQTGPSRSLHCIARARASARRAALQQQAWSATVAAKYTAQAGKYEAALAERHEQRGRAPRQSAVVTRCASACTMPLPSAPAVGQRNGGNAEGLDLARVHGQAVQRHKAVHSRLDPRICLTGGLVSGTEWWLVCIYVGQACVLGAGGAHKLGTWGGRGGCVCGGGG